MNFTINTTLILIHGGSIPELTVTYQDDDTPSERRTQFIQRLKGGPLDSVDNGLTRRLARVRIRFRVDGDASNARKRRQPPAVERGHQLGTPHVRQTTLYWR